MGSKQKHSSADLTRLTDIKPAEVSIVTAGANGWPLLVIKNKKLQPTDKTERSDMGRKKKNKADATSVQKGENLSALLEDAIGILVADGTERSDVLDSMAQEAGIDVSTVGQILDASSECPELERLEGFSRSLDLSLDDLIAASEADGCEIVNEADDTVDDEEQEAEAIKSDGEETPSATAESSVDAADSPSPANSDSIDGEETGPDDINTVTRQLKEAFLSQAKALVTTAQSLEAMAAQLDTIEVLDVEEAESAWGIPYRYFELPAEVAAEVIKADALVAAMKVHVPWAMCYKHALSPKAEDADALCELLKIDKPEALTDEQKAAVQKAQSMLATLVPLKSDTIDAIDKKVAKIQEHLESQHQEPPKKKATSEIEPQRSNAVEPDIGSGAQKSKDPLKPDGFVDLAAKVKAKMELQRKGNV